MDAVFIFWREQFFSITDGSPLPNFCDERKLMNYPVKRALVFLMVLFVFVLDDVSAASVENRQKQGVYLNEISIGSGYCWGEMKKEPTDCAVYPLFARIGLNMNPLVGIEGCQSTLQFAVEPFVNAITVPQTGVETGCSIGLRYLHNLSVPLDLFVEGSAAPMFLSIRSAEQGEPGFNFLIQTGVGFQYKATGSTAIFAGYRFRHISHGGVVDRPNSGINSNVIIAGLSWLY